MDPAGRPGMVTGWHRLRIFPIEATRAAVADARRIFRRVINPVDWLNEVTNP
jgi:hypothetical protein